MNDIDKIYSPYDYSKIRSHVFALTVTANGPMKIDEKIPGYVRKLRGIFVSVDCLTSAQKVTGYISLNFNGSALKISQMPVIRTNLLKDRSHPFKVVETLKANSLLQGYYYDATNGSAGYPYSLKIYLDYEPIELISHD